MCGDIHLRCIHKGLMIFVTTENTFYAPGLNDLFVCVCLLSTLSFAITFEL